MIDPDLNWVTTPSKNPLLYDGKPVKGFSANDIFAVMRPIDPSRAFLLDYNPIYWAQDLITPFHGSIPTVKELIDKTTGGGIVIKEKPLEGFGYLLMFRDGTGEILVAERLDPQERKITILHELAHWWLNLPGNLHEHGTGQTQRVEDWCETFAQYMECMCV